MHIDLNSVSINKIKQYDFSIYQFIKTQIFKSQITIHFRSKYEPNAHIKLKYIIQFIKASHTEILKQHSTTIITIQYYFV